MSLSHIGKLKRKPPTKAHYRLDTKTTLTPKTLIEINTYGIK